jgi:hypothetical protein
MRAATLIAVLLAAAPAAPDAPLIINHHGRLLAGEDKHPEGGPCAHRR